MTGLPQQAGVAAPSLRGRALAIGLVVAGLALVVAANAHFLYVAVTSQPDCVPYNRAAGDNAAGTYGAAKPAC